MAIVPTPQQFNNIAAMSGLVNVLSGIVGDDCGRYVSQSTGQPTTAPAIYIGRANDTTGNYPRIVLTYQGSNDGSSRVFESGLIEVEDPNDPQGSVIVPYTSSYLRYGITLTASSGGMDDVLEAYAASTLPSAAPITRLSSEALLSKIRLGLLQDKYLKEINAKMLSSIQPNSPIVPVPVLSDTEYLDSSTMTLFFDTIDTLVEYDAGWFDTINGNYVYYRDSGGFDPDPLTGTIKVTTRETP